METAKQKLEQFTLQLRRSRGSFFAAMRPRLKRLHRIKYLNKQDLNKGLLILHRALENKIPPESEDCRLLHLIDGVSVPSATNRRGTLCCTPDLPGTSRDDFYGMTSPQLQ